MQSGMYRYLTWFTVLPTSALDDSTLILQCITLKKAECRSQVDRFSHSLNTGGSKLGNLKTCGCQLPEYPNQLCWELKMTGLKVAMIGHPGLAGKRKYREQRRNVRCVLYKRIRLRSLFLTPK